MYPADVLKFKSMLIGRTLTGIYHTEQDGPYDYLPGLHPAYYFSTVMELDHSVRLQFSEDDVWAWDSQEELMEVTHTIWGIAPGMEYKGQPVSDVTVDEKGQLVFHLTNRVMFQHDAGYGDKLLVWDHHTTAATHPVPEFSWWQKCFRTIKTFTIFKA